MQMPDETNPVVVVEGDALESLRSLPDGCVQCCVTSPPYWGGLRDYGGEGQIGLERDPADYVTALSRVFLEVRRVLNDAGALWLNIGDVFAASGKGGGGSRGGRKAWETVKERKGFRMPPTGYKMKDLTLAPFQVADRLRRDGWYLRQTVVWEKPSAVEPVRLDRPSSSHEYLFLFAKSEDYATRNPGESWWNSSVWQVPTESHPDHPAAMPRELVRRCVVAYSSPDDVVLDPFGGSGTTGHAAVENDRRALLLELSPAYAAIARRRVAEALGMGRGSLLAALPAASLFPDTEERAG
jgi:site-specific DNA-methyltransferase (cytosine-N4-specific)